MYSKWRKEHGLKPLEHKRFEKLKGVSYGWHRNYWRRNDDQYIVSIILEKSERRNTGGGKVPKINPDPS